LAAHAALELHADHYNFVWNDDLRVNDFSAPCLDLVREAFEGGVGALHRPVIAAR
jgi:hypothetical protein